jgi:hypothetical protein
MSKRSCPAARERDDDALPGLGADGHGLRAPARSLWIPPGLIRTGRHEVTACQAEVECVPTKSTRSRSASGFDPTCTAVAVKDKERDADRGEPGPAQRRHEALRRAVRRRPRRARLVGKHFDRDAVPGGVVRRASLELRRARDIRDTAVADDDDRASFAILERDADAVERVRTRARLRRDGEALRRQRDAPRAVRPACSRE